MHCNRVVLTESVDFRLLGGYILKIDDQQLDKSFFTQLSKIQQQWKNN